MAEPVRIDWVPTDAWICIRDGSDRNYDGMCLILLPEGQAVR